MGMWFHVTGFEANKRGTKGQVCSAALSIAAVRVHNTVVSLDCTVFELLPFFFPLAKQERK